MDGYLIIIIAQFIIIIILSICFVGQRRKAERDQLTGLLNRQSLKRTFSDLSKKRFSVLMIDIDHFKSINDKLGHLAGDEVLKGVAGRIAGGIRPQDISFRYGGEEFLVILPQTDINEAEKVALRLQEKLRKPYRLTGNNHYNLQATVSMGLSFSSGEETDTKAVLDRADKALYKAKESGRDRLVSNI